MSSASPGITVVTDISANIFAVLILVLIVLLTAQASAPRAPRALEIESHFTTVERTPLSGSEMVDLLYDRRMASGTVKIDLFSDGIEVLSKDAPERIRTKEQIDKQLNPLAKAAPPVPIALYVFSHRRYGDVIDTLMRLGRTWTEISVPEALRERDASGKESWSKGFRDLLDDRFDRGRFREELARLLGSAHPSSKPRAGQGSEGAAGVPISRSTNDSIVERLSRWWQNIVSVAAILSGFGFIAWVEMRDMRI